MEAPGLFVNFSTGMRTSITSIFPGRTSYSSLNFGPSSSCASSLCLLYLFVCVLFLFLHEPSRPQRTIRYIRAVTPAVPYWNLVPVTTPTPLFAEIGSLVLFGNGPHFFREDKLLL